MRHLRQLVVLLSALSCFVAAPATAATVQSWPGCTGGFNSGSFDGAGRTYVPCGNPTTVGIYDTAGKLVDQFDAATHHTDVAPTIDGNLVYAAGPAGPMRYRRAGDGSWARDLAWAPVRYPIWGTSYPAAGFYVAVDARGNSYYADGMWASSNVNTVVKYDPTGQFLTRFGEWQSSWALGGFHWNVAGIAVTPDGSKVLTAEVGNNRIQTWTNTRADGSLAPANEPYTAKSSFGATEQTDPQRTGICDYEGWAGRFAASYDVNLDATGNVYVINTTCKQVLVFDPTLTRMIASHDVRAGVDYPRPHGFAVGPNGMVFVGENERVVVPGAVAAVTGPPIRAGAPVPAPAPAERAQEDAGLASVAPPAGGAAPGAAAGLQDTEVPATSTADRTAPTPRLTLARHRLVGAVTRRQLALAVRCTETCAVRIDILRGSQLIGRSFAAAHVRPRALRVALASRRSVGVATIRVLARDARGNRSTRSYRVYLGR
ncbi:MAG: hypothetical protein JWM90_1635 [Thermoleophilia bacterium]|nr:hypothetical protein [Thermoleophilia bacterium]